jgi:hypothetical protein
MNKINQLTTISIKGSTKDELDEFKVHPRQSYDEVIGTVIKLAKKQKQVVEGIQI